MITIWRADLCSKGRGLKLLTYEKGHTESFESKDNAV